MPSPLSYNFQKACRATLPFYFDSLCPSAVELSFLFLSFVTPFFSSRELNAAKLFLSAASNANLKLVISKVEGAVGKDVRLLPWLIDVIKIFKLTSLHPDMPRLSLPKAEAEAWQATCSSLS